MDPLIIEVVASLERAIGCSDDKTKKLFQKQKQFMSLYPNYPSLGRTKLENITDKYGNPLWEIRLDRKRRIVFVERDNGTRVIWLKLVTHDDIARNQSLSPQDEY